MQVILGLIPLILLAIRHIAEFIFGDSPSYDSHWVTWKITNSKSFDNFFDEFHYYSIYMENHDEIEEHNAKYEAGLVGYWKGPNKFSDLTKDEFIDKIAMDGTPEDVGDSSKEVKHKYTGQAAIAIDWRTEGVVSKVVDQGNCKSSWAHAAIGAIEGQYAILHKNLVNFSPDELIACSLSYDNKGCSGGGVRQAYRYMIKEGIYTEDQYKNGLENEEESALYMGSTDCPGKHTKPIVDVTGYVVVESDHNSLKDALSTAGPIAVNVDATILQSYEGGIFRCSRKLGKIRHSVLLVGYGEEYGKPYWLLKNSWGTGWGEKGYFRLERNNSSPECGILTNPTYPIIN